MGSTLLIRADTNLQIGTGHVMRCLALAQAWRDAGGQVVFVTAHESPSLEARLRMEGIEVTRLSSGPGSIDDAVQTIDLARKRSVDWIALDGYHFGSLYQRKFRGGPYLLVLDDYGHAEHYYADVVLNQNLYAKDDLYPNREPHTRLLLGSRYVLLRREFSKWREWKREIPQAAHKILVTLGGSDPNNMTLQVVHALHSVNLEGLEVVVTVGGNNPYVEEIQSAIRRARLFTRMESDVMNMPDLMAWAELAISAAGSTCWELAFMGLPSMIMTVAKNQERAAKVLAEKKVFLLLGSASKVEGEDIVQGVKKLSLTREARQELSINGKALIDGCGVYRVLQTLSEIAAKRGSEGDCLAGHQTRR
jgi:UDP-2,4-diacetamido-2,4,6-trideoxy-beta-L-altropyranose hydrolase